MTKVLPVALLAKAMEEVKKRREAKIIASLGEAKRRQTDLKEATAKNLSEAGIDAEEIARVMRNIEKKTTIMLHDLAKGIRI